MSEIIQQGGTEAVDLLQEGGTEAGDLLQEEVDTPKVNVPRISDPVLGSVFIALSVMIFFVGNFLLFYFAKTFKFSYGFMTASVICITALCVFLFIKGQDALSFDFRYISFSRLLERLSGSKARPITTPNSSRNTAVTMTIDDYSVFVSKTNLRPSVNNELITIKYNNDTLEVNLEENTVVLNGVSVTKTEEDVSTVVNYIRPSSDNTDTDNFIVVFDDNTQLAISLSKGDDCTLPSHINLNNGQCVSLKNKICKLNDDGRVVINYDGSDVTIPSSVYNVIRTDKNQNVPTVIKIVDNVATCTLKCSEDEVYDEITGSCKNPGDVKKEGSCQAATYMSDLQNNQEYIDYKNSLPKGAKVTHGGTGYRYIYNDEGVCVMETCKGINDNPPGLKGCPDTYIAVEGVDGFVRQPDGCCIKKWSRF